MAISNININIPNQLIIEAQNGDIEARNKLIELSIPQMKKCIRDKRNFDDVLQNAVIRLIKYLNSFDVKKGNFNHWLSVLTKNVCYRFYNNQQANLERAFSVFPFEDMHQIFERSHYVQPVEPKEHDQTTKKIMNIVENVLPVYQRKSFELFFLEGLKHSEIAEYLGISEGTSKSHINRVRKTIIQELNK